MSVSNIQTQEIAFSILEDFSPQHVVENQSDYFQFMQSELELINLGEDLLLDKDNQLSSPQLTITTHSPFSTFNDEQLIELLERFFTVLDAQPLEFTWSGINSEHLLRLRSIIRMSKIHNIQKKRYQYAAAQTFEEIPGAGRIFTNHHLCKSGTAFNKILENAFASLAFLRGIHELKSSKALKTFAKSIVCEGIEPIHIKIFGLIRTQFEAFGLQIIDRSSPIEQKNFKFIEKSEQQRAYMNALHTVAVNYYSLADKKVCSVTGLCRFVYTNTSHTFNESLVSFQKHSKAYISLIENIEKVKKLFERIQPRLEHCFYLSKSIALKWNQVQPICSALGMKAPIDQTRFLAVINLLNCTFGHQLINSWNANIKD